MFYIYRGLENLELPTTKLVSLLKLADLCHIHMYLYYLPQAHHVPYLAISKIMILPCMKYRKHKLHRLPIIPLLIQTVTLGSGTCNILRCNYM